MSSNLFRRTVIGAVAAAGAVSLAACNSGNSASVTTPPSHSTTSSTSSAAPTSSTTTPVQTPSSSSSSSSSRSSRVQPTTNDKLTPNGTNLKYGQPAVINGDSSGKFKLAVKSMVKAPASAYAAANLNKSNGTLYYVNFDVTNLGGSKYGFHPTSVNMFELRPVFGASQKGRTGGAPLQDMPGCKAGSYTNMSVGQTASACYFYQITGPAPTQVMWYDFTTKIVWSK